VQPKVHNPERQQGESFAAYRERRAESHNIVRAATRGWYGDGKQTSRQIQRADQRRSGASAKRVGYGAALIAHWADKRKQALRPAMSDANGAYTTTGATTAFVDVPRDPRWHHLGGCNDGSWFGRRIWLAGISAQRGW